MPAEKVIPRPGPPPLRPRSPSREYIGNDEAAEEVTRCTDRDLLLRALNELLQVQYSIGQLMTGVAEAKTAALDARAIALRVEAALGAEKVDRQAAVRGVAESIPDVDGAIEAKLTEHRLEIAEEEKSELKADNAKRDDRQWAIRLAFITAVVTAVVTGGAATLIRLAEVASRGHW